MALFRRVPPLTLAVALLIVGAALAGEAVLYSHRERSVHPAFCSGTIPCWVHETRGWIAPTMVGVGLVAVSAAAWLLLMHRRSSS